MGRYVVSATIDGNVIRYFREYGVFIIAGILFSTPIMKLVKGKIKNKKVIWFEAVIVPVAYGIIFLWAVSFLILGVHNPFIYFDF